MAEKESLLNTPANLAKIQAIERSLQERLSQICTKGFFGNLVLDIAIQDGTIQSLKVQTVQSMRS